MPDGLTKVLDFSGMSLVKGITGIHQTGLE